jgi:hypothetical protein
MVTEDSPISSAAPADINVSFIAFAPRKCDSRQGKRIAQRMVSIGHARHERPGVARKRSAFVLAHVFPFSQT